MKASAKALLWFILGAGLIVGLSLLALSLSGGGSTHAQGPILLAIDMDPHDTLWPPDAANTCPGDGTHNCIIGTIDNCQSVVNLPGTTFDVDAVVMGLSGGHSGWTWDLAFPDTTTPANLTLTGEVLQSSAVNLIVQSPGSCPGAGGSGAPDATSPHVANAADFCTQESTPPFTQGVLARMTFSVGAGAVGGLYSFSFVPGTYQVFDEFSSPYPQVTVLDHSAGCGWLAIGIPCPYGPCPNWTPVPAGGIAELPDAAGSSGPPYATLAGLAVVALVALTAGAWYARKRWAR